MPRPTGIIRPISKPWTLAVAAATCAVGLGACTDFARIDRDITRLVRERSQSLGPSTLAPRLASPEMKPGGESGDRSTIYETELATRNPSAEEIAAKAADPSRDVRERLNKVYEEPDNALQIDLETTYRLAQESARDFITAEEDYILSAIRLLIERHDWNPRFFNDLSVDLDYEPDSSGSTAALNVINDLRVTQRLPYGGNLEASLITRATQQLTTLVGDQYSQGSTLALSANFPLLRNSGMIARESLIQSERSLIYAARSFERFRRTFLVSIASDYFSLVAQRASLRNEEARLVSIRKLREQQAAFVDAGRSSPFELQNVRQNELSSEASLANSKESFQVRKDRFKIRLGLPVTTPIQIVRTDFDVREPDVSLVEIGRASCRERV